MKNILVTGLVSIMVLTACKKDDQVAEKSLEQQKMEFQARQLEIEKQKLAIEKVKGRPIKVRPLPEQQQ